jgi:predicted nucleic acid-binding protein
MNAEDDYIDEEITLIKESIKKGYIKALNDVQNMLMRDFWVSSPNIREIYRKIYELKEQEQSNDN